ncbi:MAG: hypothetical protein WD448_04815 [Woeseia sp.]
MLLPLAGAPRAEASARSRCARPLGGLVRIPVVVALLLAVLTACDAPMSAAPEPSHSFNIKCWDWWGYTGPQYATKEGPQIAAVISMLHALIDGPG